MLTARAAVALVLTVALLVTPGSDAPSGGLVPVGWRMAWTAPDGSDSVVWHYGTPLYGVSEQVLVMVDDGGAIRVRDARTGVPTRSVGTFDGTVAGVWVAAGTIVVFTEKEEGRGQLLHAYDLATGAALWRRAVSIVREGHPPGSGSYRGQRVMVTEAGVVVAERQLEPLTLLSLDLRSGRTLTSTVHERNCDLLAEKGAHSVLLLDYCTGNRVRLSSVDPATLRPFWTRTLPPPALTFPNPRQAGDPPLLALIVSGDGYAEVVVDEVTAFYTPDGRRLPTDPGSPTSTATVRGGRWTEPFRAGTAGTHVSGSTRWPLPAFLTSLDRATGRLHALPLDVPYAGAYLVGTAGDLAFVHSGGSVSAYVLTYGAAPDGHLSGLAPDDAWPDACGLLDAADLRPLADGYVPRPVTRALLGRPLPEPVQCDWIPPSDDAPAVSVSVEWVSHSDAAARRIFAAETASIKESHAYDPVTADPYLLDYLRSSAIGTGSEPEAVVGVGSVIVRLASVSRPALRLLAPVVRDELLARRGLPRPTPSSPPQMRWSFPTDGDVRTEFVVSGDGVYAAGGGRVYALDASSGRPRWARTIGDHVAGFQVADGQVYGLAGNFLHAFDARTGRQKWRYQGKQLVMFTAGEGRVVLCGYGGTDVLDAATGRRLWRSGERGCTGRPVIGGGAVYVPGQRGIVHALDAATGRHRWSARGDGDVTPAGKTVYLGTGNRVRALDAASGAERWSTPVGDGAVSATVLSGTAFYARDSAGTLHALDARTGEKRWTFSPGIVDTFPLARATVSGSRLYLVGPGGIVHALDAASGTELWSTRTGGGSVSAPISRGDIVYADGGDNAVHALDSATGARKWRVIVGSPAAIGPVVEGGLAYASGSGNVYAIGPAPGPGRGR
ncbi:PQQ-binding-like beta-propeller repeat protein [Nonomuraea longicatena]|uniref:Pyrrolo-quinoline quinone repeat domain-containing protein n=1 Tax=Nonomuraea longicatena TaxID=83682 RepID=A0ABN1Q9M5_9ACTN